MKLNPISIHYVVCLLLALQLVQCDAIEQTEADGLSSSSGSSQQQHGGSVSWFVQLSDLHINRYVHHDILPDLEAFGRQVLASSRPGALLITGDLVDAKTRPEGSQQHKEEWQAYEQAWRQLAQSAGLPPSAILDLRGNHDMFDTLRNSREDYFATHSATAAAAGQEAAAVQRVWVSQLKPQLLLVPPRQQQQQQQQQLQRRKWQHRHWQHSVTGERRRVLALASSGSSSRIAGSRNASSSAASEELPARPAGRVVLATRSTHAAAAAAACPAAVLVGVDFTPNIGLHSPANFLGVAGPGLLRQLQQQLQQLRTDGSSGSTLPPGCSPGTPIISYSHYPFSTVAAAYGSRSTDRMGLLVQGGRAVREVLQRADVSAHLSGHLHDLLGPRMQAMHSKGPAAAGGAAAYLADWETADWKQRRRFRFVAVDSGATSFADMHFRRSYCSIAAAAAGTCDTSSRSSSSDGSSTSSGSSSSSSSGYSYVVSSVDSSRVVSQHVVMLTWPPDGRYSPLSAAQAHPGSSSSSEEAGHPQGLHDYKGKNSHYKAADNADYEAVAGGTPAPGSTGSTGHTAVLPVRALVAPLLLHGDASAKRLTAVALDWACQGSAADLAAGSPSRGRTLGSKLMHPVGHPAAADTADEGHQPTGTDPAAAKYPYNLAEPQVFAAGVPLSPGELASQCSSSGSSVLLLQVTVHDDAGGVSTSELRPVVLAHTAGGSSDGSVGAHGFSTSVSHGAAAARGHLPLPSSVAEETLLTFDGGAFAVGLFMTGWLAQLLGLLLVPRLFGSYILTLSAFITSSSSSSGGGGAGKLLRHQQSMAKYQLADSFKQQSFSFQCRPLGPAEVVTELLVLLARVLRGAALQLARLLLLPFVSMAVLAQQHSGVWWGVLGHCAWVAVGPWFAAQMSTSSQGLGLWFRYGLLLPLPADLAASWVNGDAGSPFWGATDRFSDVISGEDSIIDASKGWQEYVWLAIPDTHLLSSLTVCITLAPITLWLGLVVRHWHAVAAAAQRSSGGCSGVTTAAAPAAAGGEDKCTEGKSSGATAYIVADSRAGEGTGTAMGVIADGPAAAVSEVELQQKGSSSSNSSNSTAVAAAGEVGCSNSSRGWQSMSRLGRSRNSSSSSSSNPVARRRESGELAASAAAGSDDAPLLPVNEVAGEASQAISRSGSSRDTAACDESSSGGESAEATDLNEEQLPLPPAATASAVGSKWLLRLLPHSLLPSSSSSSSDKASAAVDRRVLALLSPGAFAWRLLYLLLLAVRAAVRALQLCMVSARIPLPLLLLAAPPWAFWYKVCWRLAAAYGPVALLLSPVVGWLPLLVVLALRRVRAQLAAGKARRRE